jgi:hypothetical protein
VEKRAEELAAEVGLDPRPAATVVEDPAALNIHMPNPSYWPLVAAVGTSMVFAGFLLSPYIVWGFLPIVSVLGVLVLIVGIYGWSFEPAG